MEKYRLVEDAPAINFEKCTPLSQIMLWQWANQLSPYQKETHVNHQIPGIHLKQRQKNDHLNSLLHFYTHFYWLIYLLQMHILDVSHKWFGKISFYFLKKGQTKIVPRIKREKNKKLFFHCIVTKGIPSTEKWFFQDESLKEMGKWSVFSKFHSLNCTPWFFFVCLFFVCFWLILNWLAHFRVCLSTISSHPSRTFVTITRAAPSFWTIWLSLKMDECHANWIANMSDWLLVRWRANSAAALALSQAAYTAYDNQCVASLLDLYNCPQFHKNEGLLTPSRFLIEASTDTVVIIINTKMTSTAKIISLLIAIHSKSKLRLVCEGSIVALMKWMLRCLNFYSITISGGIPVDSIHLLILRQLSIN